MIAFCPGCQRPMHPDTVGRLAIDQRLLTWSRVDAMRLYLTVLDQVHAPGTAPEDAGLAALRADAASGWTSAALARQTSEAFFTKSRSYQRPKNEVPGLDSAIMAWNEAAAASADAPARGRFAGHLSSAIAGIVRSLQYAKDDRYKAIHSRIAETADAIGGSLQPWVCRHPATIAWDDPRVPLSWRVMERVDAKLSELLGAFLYGVPEALIRSIDIQRGDARVQDDGAGGIALSLRFARPPGRSGVVELRLIPPPAPPLVAWAGPPPACLLAFYAVAGQFRLFSNESEDSWSGFYPTPGSDMVSCDEWARLETPGFASPMGPAPARLADDVLWLCGGNSDCLVYHRCWNDASGDPVLMIVRHDEDPAPPTAADLARCGLGQWLLDYMAEKLF